MTETTTITVRVPTALKDRLDALADSTKRSKSYLAAEAIDQYVALNEWQIKQIQEALDQANAGGPFVAQEDVEVWVESWGTDSELPPPKATIRTR